MTTSKRRSPSAGSISLKFAGSQAIDLVEEVARAFRELPVALDGRHAGPRAARHERVEPAACADVEHGARAAGQRHQGGVDLGAG